MAGPTLYKYVDDTTLRESLSCTSQVSDIDSYIKCLLSWTTQNSMKINYSKAKEMLLGPLSMLIIPCLVTHCNSVERVCAFKLLGVYISNDMSWNLNFVSEQMLAYITSNGLSVLVFLLTDLLLGIPPSLDQFLNNARLFGTTA